MNDLTRAYIELVKSSNALPDQKALMIYGRLVSDEKLFDKAFFGHKSTKKERRRLAHLWQLSMKLGGMDGSTQEGSNSQPSADNPGGLHRAGADQGPPLDSDPRGQEEEPTSGPRAA